MGTRLPSRMFWVLVVGTPDIATRLATELKLRGFWSWAASSEHDLAWVLNQEWMRIGVAIADLRGCEAERAGVIGLVEGIAERCCSQSLIVGLRSDEQANVPSGGFLLPPDADTDEIAAATIEARGSYRTFGLDQTWS
jgi:hypothetical protein